MVKKEVNCFLGSYSKMKNSYGNLPISICATQYLCKFQQRDNTMHTMWTIAIGYLQITKTMLHDCNLEPSTIINNFRSKSSLPTTGSPHFPPKKNISLVIKSWYIISETFLTVRSKGNYEFDCILLPHVQQKQRASKNYCNSFSQKMPWGMVRYNTTNIALQYL